MSQPNRPDRTTDEYDVSENATAPIRRHLALLIIGLLVAIALIATTQHDAMSVLDKVLPLVMVVVGFFFGHQVGRA